MSHSESTQSHVNGVTSRCRHQFQMIQRTGQSDKLSLGEGLVTVLHNLTCSAHQIHVMHLQEARYNIRTKKNERCGRHASNTLSPSGHILVRIGPQQTVSWWRARDHSPQVDALCTPDPCHASARSSSQHSDQRTKDTEDTPRTLSVHHSHAIQDRPTADHKPDLCLAHLLVARDNAPVRGMWSQATGASKFALRTRNSLL